VVVVIRVLLEWQKILLTTPTFSETTPIKVTGTHWPEAKSN